MGISFNQIPSSLRVPFLAVEFDSSAAQQGPALLAYRAILIGQKTSSGSATANVPVRSTSPDQTAQLAGRGSMLHRMHLAWYAQNKSTELWLGVLADNGSGVAQQGTITVTGPATASGTLFLYFGGVRVTVGVTSGDAQNAIATAINAAIAATPDLPITATVGTNVVTWTFRHKGACGADFDVRANYQPGEATPAGVSLAFALTTAGTTNPVLTTLIANMGDSWYQVIAHPYTDATSLTAIEAELEDRFGPMRAIDGVAITSAAGSYSTLVTLGTGRNSKQNCIVAQPGANPLTPPMEYAAATAALVAFYGQQDPARPFQTLELTGVRQPAEVDLFSNEERNLLLFNGVATTKPAAGGAVQLERIITTWQTNAAGSPDTAYLDATTRLTLLYLRYSWRARLAAKYPRHKLANDGVQVAPGQAIITPKIGKAEALGWFDQMGLLGLVENKDQFKRDLLCVRSDSDPNRLEWLLPPDLINQLVVAASQIQFRL